MPLAKPIQRSTLAFVQNRKARERYRGYAQALTYILRDTKKLEGDDELAMFLEMALIILGQRLGHLKEPSEMTPEERLQPTGLVSFK